MVDPATPDDPLRVSAVVVNYQGALHLGPCLDGLAAQTLPVDELLVVDNASTDGSAALATERWPAARVERLPENRGPCPARNRGLELARNAWVLLLDNDAVLEPDVLEKLAAAVRAHPEAVVLQPRSVFASEPGRVHYDGGDLHYVGLFALRNFHVPLDEAVGDGVVPVDGVVSVALLVRRDVLLALGAFEEAFFILFEDLDLSMRLRAAGRTLLSVEDALVLHRGGTPGISFRSGRDYPARRAFFHSRNRWVFLARNLHWRTLLVAAPGIALYELVWLAFTLVSGTLLAHVKGKFAFLGGLPATLRARRRIQAARTVPDRELLVGGPLTVAPHLLAGGASRAVLGLLDAALRLWWRLVRPLAG